MGEKYYPPQFNQGSGIFKRNAFHCPYCEVYADQSWYDIYYNENERRYSRMSGIRCSLCSHCGKCCLWVDSSLVYPAGLAAPIAAEDMPLSVKPEYNEARSIAQRSPRGAAALLRLAVQKLMPELSAAGKDLNAQIGDLVKKGLPAPIQQSLDALRVIGNNAVHPGELDLQDDNQTVNALFGVLNLIVETMITQPKKVAELYSALPQGALEAIVKRDGPSV